MLFGVSAPVLVAVLFSRVMTVCGTQLTHRQAVLTVTDVVSGAAFSRLTVHLRISYDTAMNMENVVAEEMIELTDCPELASVAQVAAVLGCAPGLVRKRLRDHDLAYVKVGRYVRIPRAAVRAYLVSRLVPARERAE